MIESPRRRLSIHERRAELLAAGMQRFSEDGFWDRSVDQLARDAGASKALLLHYFGSKRGYFLAVVGEIADRVSTMTEIPAVGTREQRLRHLIAAFARFASEHPAVYQLLRGDLGGDVGVQAIAQKTRVIEVERILGALGVASNPRLRVAAFGCVGFIESAVLTWVEDQPFPMDELVELAMLAVAPLLELTKEEA